MQLIVSKDNSVDLLELCRYLRHDDPSETVNYLLDTVYNKGKVYAPERPVYIDKPEQRELYINVKFRHYKWIANEAEKYGISLDQEFNDILPNFFKNHLVMEEFDDHDSDDGK